MYTTKCATILSLLLALIILVYTNSFGQTKNSLRKINKKFLITLQITQDQAGNPSVDAARLAEITADIAVSSDFFKPLGVSFEVGEVYYIDNYQYNVISTEDELVEMSSKYDKENRYNVYLFELFDEDLEGGCGIAGQVGGVNKHVYFSQSCVNGGSFAHETGHFLGLPHTFGASSVTAVPFIGTTELVTRSSPAANCTTDGDGICDTPADPYNPDEDTASWIEDCAFVYDGQDANGDYYDPDLGNIMSYYFEGCACGLSFTHGQFEKMSATYFGAIGTPPGTGICIW